ncbi:MAG: cobamide remodeling phosphodiesterase CbiR [Desulfosalsimonadaceae bacterium]
MYTNTKKRPGLPFRLGTTSYIIPADILPNLRFLAHRVDDVELVLFESDQYSNLPTASDVAEMASIGEESGLTYTVHLPLDAWPGSTDEAIRKTSMEKWLRVMDLMDVLHPFGWIVHLDTPPLNDASAVSAWQEQCRRSLETLARRVDASKLCVETLSYDYSLAWPPAFKTGCSVCMDVGHLVLNDYDVAAYFDSWFDRTRVVHLHGVRSGGRDHSDLRYLDSGILRLLMEQLTVSAHIPRVVTLEIFSQTDLEISLRVLEGVF